MNVNAYAVKEDCVFSHVDVTEAEVYSTTGLYDLSLAEICELFDWKWDPSG